MVRLCVRLLSIAWPDGQGDLPRGPRRFFAKRLRGRDGLLRPVDGQAKPVEDFQPMPWGEGEGRIGVVNRPHGGRAFAPEVTR